MTDPMTVPVKRADGQETTLGAFKGKVVLVVNVASKCGLTKQYEGLEALFEEKQDDGLVIAAFPANNFKGQEPGTDAEILEFCQLTYDVKFPIFSKISVKGEDKHPLYQALTASGVPTTGDGPMKALLRSKGMEVADDTEILWNFEKFLIGRDGEIKARFAPDVTADDVRLTSAIDKELAAA
ncbi:glutathione peroxidase [Rhizobium halophytocola]|uniref:Glutathione peroxidase n=1 Tax=Rhizobium halophytocola TaxID=735519 RepID=A0ABS4DTL7_9HYPH|nr:glutathione peroxidase [Rhizobium halophytocola]MBP1849024.1 glutathione peroxidase [Rhizobium halophytocola]